MRKATLALVEALTGLAVGVTATLVLLQTLQLPSATRELTRSGGQVCRAGPRAPYFDGDIVTLRGTAFVCDGRNGTWQHLSDHARQRASATGGAPLWSNY